MKDQYYQWLVYQGVDGTTVQLEFDRSQLTPYRWSYRLSLKGHSGWYIGGKDKFRCLVTAANHCGKSFKAMDWEPVVSNSPRSFSHKASRSIYQAWSNPADAEAKAKEK